MNNLQINEIAKYFKPTLEKVAPGRLRVNKDWITDGRWVFKYHVLPDYIRSADLEIDERISQADQLLKETIEQEKTILELQYIKIEQGPICFFRAQKSIDGTIYSGETKVNAFFIALLSKLKTFHEIKLWQAGSLDKILVDDGNNSIGLIMPLV